MIFAGNLPLKEDDTVLKGSVSYQPNDDLLFFATWSEGFRPGGFNRNEGVPPTYVGDEMTNIEFGWKTTLANDTVRFNGSVYQLDWDNMQIGVTDFENFGVLTFVLNAADAEIRGFEGDLTWYPNDNWRIAAAWHSQLVWSQTDDQYSSIVVANRFKQQAYSTLDGAIGLSADNWNVELFAENITDERAELFINSLDTDLRITTNRPRTWGVRVSFDF